MKKYIHIFILLLTLIACEKGPTFSVTLNPDKGSVKGAKVAVSSDFPLNVTNNKAIHIKKTARGTSVDFKNIPAGRYTITVKHENYLDFVKNRIEINNSTPGYTVNLISKNPIDDLFINDNESNND